MFHGDGRQAVYAVDVRYGGDKASGEVKAQLYLDGRHHAESKVPAVFSVEGGTIEVAVSAFGMKRCHYVTTDGAERPLTPDPKSAEGRRARLDRKHPALSRWIGVFSVIMLIIGVGINLVQILEPISQIPRSPGPSGASSQLSAFRCGSTSRSGAVLRWGARSGRSGCATTGYSTARAADVASGRVSTRSRSQGRGRR